MAARQVLVTGAASGIGKAVASRVVEDGGRAILADRDREGGAALAASLDCPFLPCDLGDLPGAVENLPAAVKAEVEALDGIVNVAGISSRSHFPNVEYADWERVLRVNLSAPFFLVQALSPLLRRPGGAVVNVTSVEAGGVYSASRQPTPDYAAAKAGLKLATECLAMDLAREGIRVNAVAPGMTATPLTEGMREELAPHLDALVPLGRWGMPEDVAGAVAYLLGDDAAYVNGATIVVDGGLTLGLTEHTYSGAGRG
jgi:NAD(P)-dependent dehydrogenase (short-subunit alcohol dehydrogenase family)